MPAFCGVLNCSNRSDRDKKSYFRLPAVLSKGSELKNKLSAERRERWIAVLKRADLTDSKLQWLRVCEEHFVTGKPSSLEDKDHPDWVPSQKLGYGSARSVADCSRYERRLKRKVSSLAEDHSESDGLCDEPHHKDVQVQTDITMNELDMQQQVHQDVQLELTKVKEQLKKITLNDDSFKGDDEKVKYYTGLPTYALLLVIFDIIQPYLKETSLSALSKFQKVLLTLMHLRLNFDFTDLGYRFGVSKSASSRAFHACLRVMHERLSRMVFWPERSELVEKVPSSFLDAFGKKATIIIDCFEIKIEKPSNVEAAAQCYSHYKSSNTAKYLIGISPQGVIIFISSAWGGRTSDKHIVQNSGLLEKLLPGDLVLADRGFNVKEDVELYCAEIKIPAFTKGKKQLTAIEVETTRNLAHVRIHVERVIGQLRQKYRILSDIMPLTLVKKTLPDSPPVIDQILVVCSALVNFMPSVIPFD